MAEVIPTAPSQHTMFKIYLDPLNELNKYNYQIVPNVLVKMLVSHWEFLLYCLELFRRFAAMRGQISKFHTGGSSFL